MTRSIVTLLMIGISASSMADIRNFESFSIDVPTEWTHNLEPRAGSADLPGELITLNRPTGIGELKIMSFVAPNEIGQDRLRLFTNVDMSTTLVLQEWGDFSGYQHSYVERESYFEQWWLLNGGTILVITYESDADAPQVEIEAIEEMLSSIQINRA